MVILRREQPVGAQVGLHGGVNPVDVHAVAYQQVHHLVLAIAGHVRPRVPIVDVAAGGCHHQYAALGGEDLLHQAVMGAQRLQELIVARVVEQLVNIRPDGQLLVSQQLPLHESQRHIAGSPLPFPHGLHLHILAQIQIQRLDAPQKIGHEGAHVLGLGQGGCSLLAVKGCELLDGARNLLRLAFDPLGSHGGNLMLTVRGCAQRGHLLR